VSAISNRTDLPVLGRQARPVRRATDEAGRAHSLV